MKKIISTKNAPEAIGPYSQAVEANGFLYISGQIPVNPASGKVEATDIAGQTEQVFKNIRGVLEAAGYTLDDVIKSTVFLSDMANFAAMNEVYKKYYPTNSPARSTIAVKGLPMNVLVEIETIAFNGQEKQH